jgi:transcriptional regulator with XRE-family HTH domain
MTGGDDWTNIGERVRQARLAAGLSQSALGARLHLDRTMVAKIETGVRRIDALELVKLSTELDVPMGVFLRKTPMVLSHRAALSEDTSTGAGPDLFRLDVSLEEWLADVRQLVELGTLRARRPLRYPEAVDGDQAARLAARWLRDRLGVGDQPIPSMSDLCAEAGQWVLVTDVPGDGASLIDDDLAVAVISGRGDPGRRRATAAHELGHLVLGDEYSSDLGVSASRREREAVIDSFAAELLLPTSVLCDDVGSACSLDRNALVKIAAIYRTSWSLAVNQARAAQVVNGIEARQWRERTPTRAELMDAVGWAPQPDLQSVRVPASYAHAVLESWRAWEVTSTRAIELMYGQISEEDLPDRDDDELAP